MTPEESHKPTLILHIGRGKTGTSVIQRLLRDNRQRLAELGILVPDNDLALDGVFQATQIHFFRRLAPVTDEGVTLVRERLRVLAGWAAGQGARAVVVSAENLSASADFARLFVGAAALFDVQVVVYIRRQDDYLESAWSQWDFKKNPDLRAWADQEEQRADWDRLVAGWEENLPEARYDVRVYDRERFPHNDIAYDFVEVLGISPTDLPVIGGREINRRLNEISMRVAVRNAELFENRNDNRFTTFLRRYGSPKAHEPASTGLFWTAAEREALVGRYAESNERLRARHLPELPPGQLFSTTFPDPGPLLSPEAQLTRELDLLWKVVYTMDSVHAGPPQQVQVSPPSPPARPRWRRLAGAARRRLRSLRAKAEA